MAVKAGDFSVRLPVDRTGMEGKICDALNEIISLNQRQARELERLSEVVGRQGKLRQRATLPSASGEWAASMEAVNALITHLVQPWADVDRVISAVANGDLSQSMALETEGRALTGEFQRTAKTVNTMVGQLGTFLSEVTRVAREVGTEGKLGGQAHVKGVAGAWKDLTESVNRLAANLTGLVRAIAEVSTAVTKGDLSRTIAVEAAGEVAALKDNINDILDLSKIESGTVMLEVGNVPLAGIRDDIERAFRPVAEGRRLAFDVAMEDDLPPTLGTDAKRLQQVLKNLLSNAMKFTERGSVSLRIGRATGGWGAGHALLERASHVLAFTVTDTGIGIPPAKQKIVFEAFQQADASTSRRYGGTGLGLAISREIASMLGGSLQLVCSTPGEGSTFTLFVPQPYVPRAARQAEGRLIRTGAEPARFPAGDELLTAKAAVTAVMETAFFMPAGIIDDRDQLQPGDRRLLIVDDDVRNIFAMTSLLERQKLQQQLDETQRLNSELAAANRELETFSYSVAHDLRAPLRHIAGHASLLLQSSALTQNSDDRRALDRISAAAVKLGQLIDGLLEFSRVSRAQLRAAAVPLDRLVHDVQHDLEPESHDRAVVWKIAPLPEVQGDRVMLRQVFANLLGNALKYSRGRNPAIIEVDCQQTPRETVVAVHDNGAGFDMRYADKLFGVFQRLHREEEFEGTGIGLASVQRIIQRHGGRTWAEGKVDQGATFYFSLPASPN